MRKFEMPQITLIHLVDENVIATSSCNANYCDGFTCPQCDNNDNYCGVQTPCAANNCGHYLCPTY